MHLWLWKLKENVHFIYLNIVLQKRLIQDVKIEILPRTPLQRRTWVTCLLVWRSWDVQRTTACSENLVNLSTSWRTWYKCPPPRTIKWTQPEAQMTPGLDLWLAPPPWFHLWSAPAWGNNNHDNRSIFKWITMNCSFIDIILGSVSGMCNL